MIYIGVGTNNIGHVDVSLADTVAFNNNIGLAGVTGFVVANSTSKTDIRMANIIGVCFTSISCDDVNVAQILKFKSVKI